MPKFKFTKCPDQFVGP